MLFLLGFNVEEDSEVKEMNLKEIKILKNEVIYKLIEDLVEFQKEKRDEIRREKLMGLTSVCKLSILHQYVFRASNPAVFGVKVEAGRLKPGIKLMDGSGNGIAKVKGIQENQKKIEEALMGSEIAMSLPGINFERQLSEVDVLYSDISEKQFRDFKDNKDLLSSDEMKVLQKIAQIKRAKNGTWGV